MSNCPIGCGATDATLKVHCHRCGAVRAVEMRAGHAGSEVLELLERLKKELAATPRNLGTRITNALLIVDAAIAAAKRSK